jgi:hypothetical protein
MKIGVDFSEVKEREVVPAGDYVVRVGDVQHQDARQAGGYASLKWTLVITEGPLADQPISMTTSLAPQALWKLKAIFDGLGVENTGAIELETVEGGQQIAKPDLIGMVAKARVRPREYNNRTFPDVTDLVGTGERVAGANGSKGKGVS